MYISQKSISVLFFVLAIVIFSLFTSGTTTPPLMGTAILPGQKSQEVRQVIIPSYIDFAGEAAPLNEVEVRNRLDREITAITFQHAKTILILKLANKWFPVIEPILQQNGIPDDFKYLAVAESNLENLVSPKDAKGVWQLLEATAKSYGLEVNNFDVDERYHVEKATMAACKYLRNSFNLFNNWTMSAAAYNRGNSGLSEAAEHQQTKNYYNLYLNSETAAYLYRIMAYKQVLQNPNLYGFYLNPSDLYQPDAYKTIESTGGDLVQIAKNNNVSYKKMRILNPWLKDKTLKVKPGKSYSIKLPIN